MKSADQPTSRASQTSSSWISEEVQDQTDTVLRNLVLWKVSLSALGRLELEEFKHPFQLNPIYDLCSMIWSLWFFQTWISVWNQIVLLWTSPVSVVYLQELSFCKLCNQWWKREILRQMYLPQNLKCSLELFVDIKILYLLIF